MVPYIWIEENDMAHFNRAVHGLAKYTFANENARKKNREGTSLPLSW